MCLKVEEKVDVQGKRVVFPAAGYAGGGLPPAAEHGSARCHRSRLHGAWLLLS
jgi:hypothetical protein